MSRAFNTISTPLQQLLPGAANPLPKLPEGLAYEIFQSPTGGGFTGNVVTAQISPRTGFWSGILTDPAFTGFIKAGTALVAAPFTGGKSLTGLVGVVGQGVAADNAPGFKTEIVGRVPTMAFADGDSGFSFGDFFGGVSKVLQGGLGQGLLGVGTQALQGLVNKNFATGPMVGFNPTFASAAAPAVGAVVRAGGAMVARGFFNRYPNLAVSIQKLRNAGNNVTRANLWSLMKRFGPDFLISGSILTAAAVAELSMAGPGRRRMNPGNVKALRRAHRRMKSFHHVCQTNDRLMGGRGKRRAPLRVGSSSITTVRG